MPEINDEKEILKFWQENKIFKKLVKKNKNNEKWSFLDGPITANNPMGVHHAWGRTLKDLYQRFFAMQGKDQRFQNGFDCQGLWVEVEVEKELNMNSKKDIENYGIAKFVNKCKQRVKKYSQIQTDQSIRLGQWMDWDHSYYTMSDENNYAIWYFLKKCWQKNLLYKGRDVVPWCPRCGTAISQHEILSEEYQEIIHPSVFIQIPVLNQKNTYFVAWTTTPWTLPGNIALAVNPDLVYVKVKNKDQKKYIILKEKAKIVPDGKIIKEFKGKELAGLKYIGLFDEMPGVKKTLDNYQYSVILWDQVTSEEGTGVVHIAPGCGQEDFQLSQKLKLLVINLSDNESKYREGFGDLTGLFVGSKQARELIFKNLKHKNNFYKVENYRHRYPTCWRCKSELIFRLVDEWYIKMDPLKAPLINLAKKIKWQPDFGRDLEIDWLKNMQDWLISKKRYWGLALPIYECKKCGQFEVIGSKKELKVRAIEGYPEFEKHSPHRPWVDRVKIKCQKCGHKVSRILDVGNPWLDAGIAPYSTMGYFKNKKYWADWFPADFICESFPGQFKNWFYSLLAMSGVLEDEIPFKAVLGLGNVLDEKGEEMHKSKGNAIWFDEAVEKVGADAMRWLYISVNPFNNLYFGYQAIREKNRGLLSFENVYNFFKTYSKIDQWQYSPNQTKSSHILDQWIIARLNEVIDRTAQKLIRYNGQGAIKELENLINDLSVWYLRRSRDRRDAKFYQTLYYVLITMTKLLAPFIPFGSEKIYQEIKTKNDPESVHLNDWPKSDEVDKKLIKQMKIIREITEIGHSIRSQKGIKVRQPLNKIIVSKNIHLDLGQKWVSDLIIQELNIKEVEELKNKKGIDQGFGSNKKGNIEVYLDTKITPKLKEEGIVREVIRQIQELRKKADLLPDKKITAYYFINNLNLKKIIDHYLLDIIKRTNLNELIFKKEKDLTDKEFDIDKHQIWLGIQKNRN